MSQYTSTFTAPDGTVTNSVLDTTTNTQTITVTAPTGQVATTTVNSSDVNSNFDNIVTNLGRQLNEQGAGGGTGVGLRGITSGINYTTANVTQQQQNAAATSTVTGNPPPAETQPIPVSTTTNPSPTPAPDIATPTPQPNPNIDPNTNIGAEIQTPITQQPINPNSDPNTNIGAEIQTPYNVAIVPSPDNTTYYENNGVSSTTISPQVNDNTTYYENNGVSSSSTIFPQLTPEEQAAAALGDAQAGAGERSFATNPSTNGLTTKKLDTNSKATQQDESNFKAKEDWRVRLSLAPGATYLYKNKGNEGILLPLAATDGVVFPYTPAISVQYSANYDNTELTHSNYKFFTYRASSVDSISITCDFTAQDTFEANYLLAVIHFFRSVTKMFYGQDQNPKIGTPPPLCYLSGLGAFQFDAHPLAITAFNYTLPTDVDYIRAGSTPTPAGVNRSASNVPLNSGSVSNDRVNSQGLNQGGVSAPPQFSTTAGSRDITYVPTKMSISISAVPIVTRNDISNKFSLTEYGTGKLLRGTQRQGGGIW